MDEVATCPPYVLDDCSQKRAWCWMHVLMFSTNLWWQQQHELGHSFVAPRLSVGLQLMRVVLRPVWRRCSRLRPLKRTLSRRTASCTRLVGLSFFSFYKTVTTCSSFPTKFAFDFSLPTLFWTQFSVVPKVRKYFQDHPGCGMKAAQSAWMESEERSQVLAGRQAIQK